MHPTFHCGVSLIRPRGTDFEDVDPQKNDKHARKLDLLIDEVHELLHEAADQANTRIQIEEHQLHEEVEGGRVVSRERCRNIFSNPLVVILDPDEFELGFLREGITEKPLHRGLIANTSKNTFESSLNTLGHSRTLVFRQNEEGVRYGKINRFFSLRLPTNDDERANLHQQNVLTAQHAILFPYIHEVEVECEEFRHLQLPVLDEEEES